MVDKSYYYNIVILHLLLMFLQGVRVTNVMCATNKTKIKENAQKQWNLAILNMTTACQK